MLPSTQIPYSVAQNSIWWAIPGTGVRETYCKGDSWTEPSSRQMRNGTSSREKGKCNSTETLNSTVHSRNYTKVRTTEKRGALKDKAGPDQISCVLRSLDFLQWSIRSHKTLLRRLADHLPQELRSNPRNSYSFTFTLSVQQQVCVAPPWKYILN